MKDQTKELNKPNNGRTLLNITSFMLVSNMIISVATNDNIGGAPASQVNLQEHTMLSRKTFLLAIFFCSMVQG